MNGNDTLRDRVLEAIFAGKLPDGSPEQTWAGPGCGAACAICGQCTDAEQLEFELQFVSRDGHRREDYHVHRECFFAWESARRDTLLRRAAMTPALSGAVLETMIAADDREPSR